MPHMGMEVFPKPGVFPKSSIATARNIATDPIELKVLTLFALFKIGELTCIVVCYEKAW